MLRAVHTIVLILGGARRMFVLVAPKCTALKDHIPKQNGRHLKCSSTLYAYAAANRNHRLCLRAIMLFL
jgi:hypothetical protein